jgi:hypothetical protein
MVQPLLFEEAKGMAGESSPMVCRARVGNAGAMMSVRE